MGIPTTTMVEIAEIDNITVHVKTTKDLMPIFDVELIMDDVIIRFASINDARRVALALSNIDHPKFPHQIGDR